MERRILELMSCLKDLGHSTPRAALIYQHATEERDHQIVAGIDALLDLTSRAPAGAVGRIDRQATRT